MNKKEIYFITGASGVGKTTLLSTLKEKYKSRPWTFLHFDEIGIPSVSVMKEEFGSPSAWQETKAHEWIYRSVYNNDSEKVFLEGQVNLQFIRNGFEKIPFSNYIVILLDCSEEEMENRLTCHRRQPELFNDDMRNWLKYLRNHAQEFGAIRIDTTYLSESETIAAFEDVIKLKSE
jgi:deoxyadenosine/deoxycytidine kinase